MSGTKTFRSHGKRWELPNVVRAGGSMLGRPRFYEVTGYRPPRAGEWYLSGAVVEAYKAPADLSSPYLVIELGPEAVRSEAMIPKGEPDRDPLAMADALGAVYDWMVNADGEPLPGTEELVEQIREALGD